MQRKLDHFVQQIWVFVFGWVLLLLMPIHLVRTFPVFRIFLVLVALFIAAIFGFPGLAGALIRIAAALCIGMLLIYVIYRWTLILNYYVTRKNAGQLLVKFQLEQEKSEIPSPIIGFVWLALGLFQAYRSFLNPASDTDYMAAALSIFASLIWFIPVRWIIPTQVYEKGIFGSDGNFYEWENIKSFTWYACEGKLFLTVKKLFQKKPVELHFPVTLRPQVFAYLEQYLSHLNNVSK